MSAAEPQLAEASRGTIRIPFVFHRVWLGGTMPDEFVRFGETWTDCHPDWQMITWSEESLPPLRDQDEFDRAPNLAQKADIARYEILARYGGVYIDCDFECQRNIEPLLGGIDVFCAWEDASAVSNAIIGAVPEHPMLIEVRDAIPARVAARPDGPTNELTGPVLMTEIATRHAAEDQAVRLFGPELFFPYHYSERHRRGEAFPEAYAIHHWQASWVAPPPAAAAAPAVASGGTPERAGYRIGVVVDLEAPVQALTVAAVYARLFAPWHPVELAMLLPDGLNEESGAALIELIVAACGNLSGAAPIVAYGEADVPADALDALWRPGEGAACAADAAALIGTLVALARSF